MSWNKRTQRQAKRKEVRHTMLVREKLKRRGMRLRPLADFQ